MSNKFVIFSLTKYKQFSFLLLFALMLYTVSETTRADLASKDLILPIPDAQFIPPIPTGWTTHPGGMGFPTWKSTSDLGAPAIGFQTDSTFPNETVAAQGSNLKGADFVLWLEGSLFSISALRTASDRAQILVPSITPDGSKVPNSVTLIWPHNSNGYGMPIRINAPKLFWTWPGKKWRSETDRNVRIFGKNLSLPHQKPLVVAKRGNSDAISLNLSYTSANEIRAELPLNYAAGNYKVWVHNGTGGAYGWSEQGSFIVATKTYNTSTVFKVSQQTGWTDEEKINNAIAAARANGGGTVLFDPRTYILSNNFYAPASGDAPIILKGAGPGTAGTLLTSPGTTENPERYLFLTGAGSGIKDMKLEGVRVSVRNQDINVDNIDASANDMPLSNYQDYMASGVVHMRQNINLNVTNSTFRAVNAGIYSGWASFMRYSNCHFYGRYFDGTYNESGIKTTTNNLDNQGISFRSTHNVIVENSDFQSEDPLNGKILTRALAVLHSAHSHHVFLNNTMKWIGAFPSSVSRDTNSGEIILFHGDDVGLISTVSSANWSSVTVNRPSTDFTSNDFGTFSAGKAIEYGLLKVIVVSGRASGQVMLLKSVKDSGTTKSILAVPRWQNVFPAAGDKVIVRPLFDENLVLNNTLDAVPDPSLVKVDFGRVGILFWTTSFDSVVSGNNIQHVGGGIHLQSAQRIWVQGANHIRGNTLKNHLSGGPYANYTKCYADGGGAQIAPEGHFYSIGNVFRDNVCSDAEMGVSIGAVDHDNIVYMRNDALYVNDRYSGIVHSIIENNSITKTGSLQHPPSPTYPNYAYFSMGLGAPAHPNLGVGVTVSANWSLIRGNTFTSPAESVDYYLPAKIYEALSLP